MIATKSRWMGAALALALGVMVWMFPALANAEFVGTLVECTQVTQPAALTTCASTQDPLTRGVATLDSEGDLDLVLVGAGTAQAYTAFFHSIDG